MTTLTKAEIVAQINQLQYTLNVQKTEYSKQFVNVDDSQTKLEYYLSYLTDIYDNTTFN